MIEGLIQQNIISIVIAIFGFGGVYSLIQFRLKLHDKRINNLEIGQRNLDKVITRFSTIVENLNENLKEFKVDVKNDFNEVKKKLDSL